MNPSELRMMWMSQYNPERITLEDATPYFGASSVGLSVMDDMTHQTTLDFNPMMSIVGGDFSGQAAAAAAAVASSAAAAAALGVQPTALIAAHSNDIYGLTHVSGLQQQLLQQSAAGATFPNYAEIIAEDESGKQVDSLDDDGTQYVPTANPEVYEAIDDAASNCYDDDGISGLASKQEIINIDDFVMMNDSNSYDGTELITPDSDLSAGMQTSHQGIDDNSLLIPCINQNINVPSGTTVIQDIAETVASTSSSSGHRTQRKTRKIEPVNRPGLVLKTPIAYKGNIDPSVIPIQKDGMAVCERCGAIGVKHTFYTKSRRFCSMSCARGELFSLVVNNKMTGGNQQPAASRAQLHDNTSDTSGQHQEQQEQQEQQTDIELALRVSHIKNSNYRFHITDHSKNTQTNGCTGSVTGSNSKVLADSNSSSEEVTNMGEFLQGGTLLSETIAPQPLEMYRDVMPQDELPQIPKFERLPTPCPQMEKMISVRRRNYDPTHSYDWTARLSQPNFYAAPVTCFPHAPGYEMWDNVGIDMKVEVENTDCDNTEVIQPGQTPHSFWVATILNICGYKALMRYEGFDDPSHDFWVNLCSSEVHSVGWCATRGKPLIPPRTIENKYKDWKDFLVERLSGARTLPSSFYNKINDSMQSRFRLGLNLECVDKDRISQVRLATVTKIIGKRLYLRYFDTDDGFWCHEDSPIIHPVGWATTVGHNLAAPQDYLERMLAGREAMIEVHEDDATIELFKMNFTFEEYYIEGKTNGFVEGMKIEAVDPLNLSSICVATVMAVLKFGYMMIRIDSYQPDNSGSDWFCYHEKSPSIFPVGFCAANNIPLTPPNGYDTSTFNWKTYLQETGSMPAEGHLFHRVIPDHGFKVGMSIECADLMDPRLVCVATVSRVVGRLLKIHFDGWTDEYDQWLDCESPDVYPVGWCVLVSHKLEGPPAQIPTLTKTASKVKQQKKRKKKGIGNRSNETTLGNKNRPTALKTNLNLSKLSIKFEFKPEQQRALAYEDNDEDDEECDDDDSMSRSDQSTPLPATTKATFAERPQLVEQQLQQPSPPQRGASTVKKSISPAPPTVGRKANSYIGSSTVSNSKYIPRLTEPSDSNTSSELQDLLPESWNVYDVLQFLRINDCIAYCDIFSRNKIDGKRLMQLSKDEMVTQMGIKVGPALKLHDLIEQLQCKINPSKLRHHKANKAFL